MVSVGQGRRSGGEGGEQGGGGGASGWQSYMGLEEPQLSGVGGEVDGGGQRSVTEEEKNCSDDEVHEVNHPDQLCPNIRPGHTHSQTLFLSSR